MTRVAKENQGLDTTFVDLENASDEEITASFRDNTKVNANHSNRSRVFSLIAHSIARLDRVSDQSYIAHHRYPPYCPPCTCSSVQPPRFGRQHLPLSLLLFPSPPRSRCRRPQSHEIYQRSLRCCHGRTHRPLRFGPPARSSVRRAHAIPPERDRRCTQPPRLLARTPRCQDIAPAHASPWTQCTEGRCVLAIYRWSRICC